MENGRKKKGEREGRKKERKKKHTVYIVKNQILKIRKPLPVEILLGHTVTKCLWIQIANIIFINALHI